MEKILTFVADDWWSAPINSIGEAAHGDQILEIRGRLAVFFKMMPHPRAEDFTLRETNPHLGGGKVVKAKDLPGKDVTGSCDPYVEVKLGNYLGKTRFFEKKSNPEWNQVSAFSKDRLKASLLEVTVKDKDVVKDDFIGKVFFDLNEIPKRVPPDSPLAPQWYRLEDRQGNKVKEELILAVWMGTQADEAFPEAWHSDAAFVSGADGDKGRYPEVFVKAILGNQALRTRISQARGIDTMWNEYLMFVAAELFEELLILNVEDRVAPNKDEVLGKCTIPLQYVDRRLDHKPVNSRWHNLEKHVIIEGEKKKETKFASRIHMRICLEGGYHVLDESTHYSSRPTTKQLWKSSIGVLELGIRNAHGLMPMKTKDGRGTTNAYCVAKYGQKWVRTRTIIDSFIPKWNEQYTWEFFILVLS
ncbi:outer envelope pore protein 16-3 [Hibiscus syriacus]|uniref:Outer envelope pore protein 16-3 n=1 Tax=Hibiscus syriacus TaxID=106335 RepID=A0A6A3AB17_HIBSY|nr:outer envelope pore protein 16-3 [Hibiscus syriacus]